MSILQFTEFDFTKTCDFSEELLFLQALVDARLSIFWHESKVNQILIISENGVRWFDTHMSDIIALSLFASRNLSVSSKMEVGDSRCLQLDFEANWYKKIDVCACDDCIQSGLLFSELFI